MTLPQRVSLQWVRDQRLATHYLTGPPAASSTDAVRAALCVQSQDAPLARWSLGMRADCNDTAVLAEQATGFVRTHILRPTWHYIAAEDLRWVQRLTADKVIRSMASRRRNLGTDDPKVFTTADRILQCELTATPAMTRKELWPLLVDDGPEAGGRLGHLLEHAELRGLITSGPPRNGEHTYVLVDDAVPANPNDTLDRPEATRLLVRRFFAGHGPATDRDLARWCTLTLTEIRAALADLGDELSMIDIDGEQFWWDEAAAAEATRRPEALLLPTFDEALLTYSKHPYPRPTPTQNRSRMIAEAAGGTVLIHRKGGYDDVGIFKRKRMNKAVEITLTLEDKTTAAERDALSRTAEQLAAFTGDPCRLTVREP